MFRQDPDPIKTELEEQQAKRLQAQLLKLQLTGEIEETRRKLDMLTMEHTDGLRAFLRYKTRGKKLDKNYESYITRLADQYFANYKIENCMERDAIVTAVFPLHRHDRLSEEPMLMENENIIGRSNYLNQLMEGKKVTYPWWNLWRPTYITLNDASENSISPYFTPERPNFWKIGTLIIASVTTAFAAKSFISRASSNLTSGSITQLVPKQLALPSTTDIIQNTLTPTIQTSLTTIYSGISDLTFIILESGPVKNSWTACNQLARELCTDAFLLLTTKLGK